ncbi:aromatic-ring-hydroxylating dioxygenase subunit beta [Niallia oryzisoli]|uniref:aromatic-ring-hydroxylating dioxygenase subunit beta n=1 Tax=Niallia oryzisoli TaxID=1737571 RepID=UPI003734E208
MLREVENFIYHEANLMDEGKYEEWGELFTEDSTYWIPSWMTESKTISNPTNELSLIYWNKNNINEYVQRLNSGDAHVMIPSPRTTRYITNILIEPLNETEFIVKSNWFLHDFRLQYNEGVQQFFGGKMEHRVVRENGEFKISHKEVIVINDNINRGHLMII